MQQYGQGVRAPDFVVEASSALGEGPCWDPRDGSLGWVDVRGRAVHTWWPDTGRRERRVLPDEVSLALPRVSGGRVVTQVDTIAVADGIHLREVCRVPADRVHTRLNDGCVDRDGALWVGTYSLRGEAEAVLLHVDPSSGEVTVVVDGLVASNGLAWSADGERLFAVDTGRSRLDVYDRVDGARPALRHRRLLVDFAGGAGRPDGIAIDADGGVWVAMWGGGEVRRYTPGGDLDVVIRVPVTYPTSVAFGDADLATLFVTTSRIHLPPAAVEPLAGHVLAYETGAHGIPLPAFAG